MNIAFAIVDLFPGGGLQRECIKLASLLCSRGHVVTIFAERTWGPIPENLKVETLANEARINHKRQLAFANDVVNRCGGRFDRIVGFGVLKNLDILYCADPSFALRSQSVLSLLTGRLRTFIALEAASFAPEKKTRCLLLSEGQLADFKRAWSTESDRLKLIPPYIDIHRRQPDLRTNGVREKVRAALGFSTNDFLWLAVASQAKLKGLDRTLLAMKAFPDARLVVAGLDPNTRRVKPVRKWAKKLGLSDKIKLLGFRNDIPELMAAADLLLHPARYDTTGGVILESIINGLPVITTPECGYAPHVSASQAGIVLKEPFSLQDLVAALEISKQPSKRAVWSKNGIMYGETADLYSGVEHAADYIESFARPT